MLVYATLFELPNKIWKHFSDASVTKAIQRKQNTLKFCPGCKRQKNAKGWFEERIHTIDQNGENVSSR